MKTKKLLEKYHMKAHEENGQFSECHYPYDGGKRAESGSSVFYVGPKDKTLFHRLDCDEYWCFNAGSNLEVWIIDENGNLSVKNFGIKGNAMPLIYFKKGCIFASKHKGLALEGTFFTCITIPRFDYKGFELVDTKEIEKICPEIKEF